MGKLADTAAGAQLAKANPTGDFKSLLASQWDRISAVMPRHMSADRLFQLAVSAYNQTPKLAECSPVSVLSCVMKCAALGLEPSAVDGLGRAYILPYRNRRTGMEAQFIIGYKGIIDLARRSGEIRDISAHAVYDGDEFFYQFGLDPDLVHVPSMESKESRKLTHAYCVAHFKDGGHYFNVLTAEDIEQARKSSQAGGSDYSPWKTHYEQMAVKTAVRRAFPYLPVSVEAQTAAAADETTPDYGGVLRPVVADMEPEPVPTEAEPDSEPPAEATESNLRAVCVSCGHVVEIAPDATLEELTEAQRGICCENPDYRMAE